MAWIPDSHADLLDAQIATLATNGPDGRPQLSVVWFMAEDGRLRASVRESRRKIANLRADPAITMLVIDPANQGRYLEVRGDAELEADPDYAFADRLGAKFGGFDYRTLDQPGDRRMVVSLVPVKINAFG